MSPLVFSGPHLNRLRLRWLDALAVGREHEICHGEACLVWFASTCREETASGLCLQTHSLEN